jgi:hypothetical protein
MDTSYMCSTQCSENKSQYSTKNIILWHIYKMRYLYSGDEIYNYNLETCEKRPSSKYSSFSSGTFLLSYKLIQNVWSLLI